MKWRAFVRSIRREAATAPAPVAPALAPEPTRPGVYVCAACGNAYRRAPDESFSTADRWFGPLTIDKTLHWRNWDTLAASTDGHCAPLLQWRYRRMYEYLAARSAAHSAVGK